MARVQWPLRRLSVKSPLAKELDGLPSFGPHGNLTGMRRNFGWQDAMPVKCGAYVYDCATKPHVYLRST